MSDTETPQPDATQTPQGMFIPTSTPTAPATDAQTVPATDTPADADKDQGDETKLGDAGRRALQAEREAKKAAESAATQAQVKLDAVLTALGIKQDGGQLDPDKLADDLRAQRAENAVLRAGAGIADVDALLDSKRFTDSLGNLDISDPGKVRSHIEEFVRDNPRYAITGQQVVAAPGVRDAAANNKPTTQQGDWLRSAIRH